jgi:hypothetical protein
MLDRIPGAEIDMGGRKAADADIAVDGGRPAVDRRLYFSRRLAAAG